LSKIGTHEPEAPIARLGTNNKKAPASKGQDAMP